MKMTGRTLRQEAVIGHKQLAGSKHCIYVQGRNQAGVDNDRIRAVLHDRTVAQASAALRATIVNARQIIARIRRVGRAAGVSTLGNRSPYRSFRSNIFTARARQGYGQNSNAHISV